jgi:glutamate-ammonia-ligase adenylyltransferase
MNKPIPAGQAPALASRIRTALRPSETQRGARQLAIWLGEIAGSSAGRALSDILAAHPPLRELLAGLGDHSPHLWELATADAKRLVRLLQADPDAHFAALLAQAADGAAACEADDEVMRLLRRMKAETALLVALCDIGGVWPVMQVTRAMTDLADAAINASVRHLLAGAARQLKLTSDVRAPETGSGYIVLAMGKMGAFELNYSSDIDLIVFYDPQAPALAEGVEPAPLFIRVTRGLVKFLSERTVDGYVFRVDLRLRPDPAATQIAISTAAAAEYYEQRGQNWERSALIKARPCAGDLAAGEKLLGEIAPFVWRKYMDFAAVADIHAMKRQIHAFRGHSEIAVAGHNIKLGRGGIREIEFFVQTQQLIAGGRHPELRDRRTLTTLHALAEGQWVSAQAARDLEAAYHFLRTVEHRLQMIADEQTHVLPSEPEELENFARFMGFDDAAAFSQTLVGHLHRVQEHYSRLFEQPVPAERRLKFPRDSDDRETLDRLSELGFARPLEVSNLVRGWQSGHYPALRGEFARTQLAEIVPMLIEQISRGGHREAALTAFDRFLANLHGGRGGRLFSLLRQNPDLVALIALILGTAPRLADTLAHYPQVMDALIDPAFFGALPNRETLTNELAGALALGTSYEDLLDRLRIFGQEQMFLIGARILSGTVSAEQAGEAFARLADVIITALHRGVEERFAEQHGRIAGQRTALLAFGKLGGREMTASSDLDLILVYDFDAAHPESDGARRLYGAQYFARLTQRLISALTAQTNYGALYNVDMRLRPSGRSGPVATQLGSFRDYQETEAWTWEHMALTRARVVSASDDAFRAEVEATIRAVLARPREAHVIAGDALEMRRAIAQEKGEADAWDLKYAAGGLIDLEFVAQYLQLVHAAAHPDILDTHTGRALDKAFRAGLLSAEDADVLRPAARLYHDLSQILRRARAAKIDPKKNHGGRHPLLARAADVPDFATLEPHLVETQARVRASFLRILGAGQLRSR